MARNVHQLLTPLLCSGCDLDQALTKDHFSNIM